MRCATFVSVVFAAAGAVWAGPLTVTSEPPGAAVSLDGQPVGNTPLTLNLPDQALSHWLEISAQGYVPVTVSFSAVPERAQAFHFVLVPAAQAAPATQGPAAEGSSASEGVWRPLPEGEGGAPPAAGSSELAALRAALERFRADCGQWPMRLSDLTVGDARQLAYLSPQARAAFRGPYLKAIPRDPATGRADWLYDSISGRVESRASLPYRPGAGGTAALPPAGDEALRAFVRTLLRAAGMIGR